MKDRIKESKAISENIQQTLSGYKFDIDNKGIITLGCLSSSLEYHSSLHLLFENRRHASATALLRPQFESYVKGIWFLYCSNDRDIRAAHKDTFQKKFHEIVDELVAKSAPGHEDIKTIKNSYWRILNGFTHTGQPQLARQFNGYNIQANYDDKFIISILNLGDFIAFRVFIELINISSEGANEDQIKNICKKTEILKTLLLKS